MNLILISVFYSLIFFSQVLSIEVLNTNNTSNPFQRSAPKLVNQCADKGDCPVNQRCLFGNCTCEINFKLDQNRKCTKYTCAPGSGANDCSSTLDPNRYCSNGQCLCKNKFKENIYSQYCEPECTSSFQCGANAVCNQGECMCYTGYRRNGMGVCQRTFCYRHTDCYYSLHDPDTHCKNSYCYCDDNYYLDSNTQMCKRKKMNPWVWAWACIFFPVAFLICGVYYIRRCRHHQHHSDVHVYRY